MGFNRKSYIDLALLLCLTLLLAQTVSAQFTGRSWSAFTGGAIAVCADELDDDTTNDDIDNDDDGLIELCYLEDVNAMREDLEGTSLKRGDSILTDGCPSSGCKGYELVRDLDFDDDGSYSNAADHKAGWTVDDYTDSDDNGWLPIEGFNARFEGNGHTISNLTINRPSASDIGLFGLTGSASEISNIGLLNVSIGADDDVGGLVGDNSGSIANSYATGLVEGNYYIGGLIGWMEAGSITNSYATSSVRGNESVGGLVGDSSGSIVNSYATGLVEGNDYIGGLVGWNSNEIENSYATGFVTTTSTDEDVDIGGLVGVSSNISNSYWDTSSTTVLTSAGGIGKNTTQLQSPTTATGIYAKWSTDNWDFGTAEQYPVLKYAQDCGASQQPDCNTLLRGQEENNQPRIISPTNNTKISITEKDAGTAITISVTVSDADVGDKLTLLLSVIEGNSVTLGTAEAKVLPNEDNAERKTNKDLSISVPSNVMSGTTILQLVVEDDSGSSNAESSPISLIVTVDVNEPPKVVPEMVKTREVTIGQILRLNTGEFFTDNNNDTLTYTATGLPDNNRFIFSTMTGVLKVTPQAADASMNKDGLSVTVTASDGRGGSASATFKLLISAEPSGDVEIKFNAIDDNTWQLVTTSTVVDANGIARTNYQWFRNGVLQSETSDTYPIPDNNSGRAGGTKYRVEVTYVDNIGQQTTKSDVYTVVNQAPVIDAINPIGTVEVKEGGNVSITASASDANHDELTYTWDVSSEDSNPSILANVPKTNKRLSFNVPADWIKDTDDSDRKETLQLEIAVTENRNGGEVTTQTVLVDVTKINNGVSATGLTIDRDENELTLREGDGVRAIAADPDSKNNSPGELYQWQWCRTSCVSPLAWMDISNATTTTYTIPNRISDIEVEGTDKFRIKFSYTDGQGYRETIFVIQEPPASAEFQLNTWSAFDGGAKAVCKNNDIDDDNDGLIELCYLEDVDAMRYDLKGSSYKYSDDATGVMLGCGGGGGNNKCFGYELVRDLDFKDDDSYISTTSKVEWTVNDYDDSNDNGWQPIGDYNALFEGNGHTISNLMINRPGTNNVGLFGSSALLDNTKFFNIGLLNVRINGNVSVGGLVGAARGGFIVMNSYVSGSVKGNANAVGLLVGYSEGSYLRGDITNSYASGSVSGNNFVGGLVGLLGAQVVRRTIANSYASGSVSGNSELGGLAGRNSGGSITNSYASGSVVGNSQLGGLIGSSFGGTAADSYWDTSSTRVLTSGGGIGKTTADLQSPTAATGIYLNWGTANWDFGTDEQYPIVKYARSGGNLACRKLDDEEPSQQPVCGTVLPGQRNKPPRIIFPTTNTEILITEDEENTTKTISVTVADDDIKDKLTLLLSSVDTKQNIVKLETIKATVLPNAKVVRDTNKELIIRTSEEIISDETILQLMVEDNSGFGNSLASVSFKVKAIGNAAPTVMPIDNISLLEGTTTTLVVGVEDVDGDSISVTVSSENPTTATVSIEPAGDENYTLGITGLSEGTATITVTANDGRGKSNSTATETFTVTVEANQAPTISIAELNQRLQVNDMVELTVSVSDANFDLNDEVTLNVESSAPSVVSVDQSEVIVTGDDTDKVFTLSAHAGGDATITISAEDSKEAASNSEMVSLHVNARPTIESYDDQVTLKAGREQSINVTVSDVNTEDALTLRLTEANPGQAVVELVTTSVMVMTNNAATRDTQALRIKGLKAGDTTLNIVAEDADTTSATAPVAVTVEPNTTPTLTIAPDPSALMLLEGTSKTLVVTATNEDTDDSNLIVNVMSDNSATATATLGTVDGSDYPLVITAIKPGTAAITVSVDDDRGTPNSTATETFSVEVAANQAPVLEIVTKPSSTVELDAETNVVISIADANFDLGDSVTLTAEVSTQSVVSVTPDIVNGIGSNTSQTFTLTGKRVGESNISFTATDLNDGQSTVLVLLRVDSSLATGTVPTEPIIATVGEAFSTDTSTFFAYSGSDTLSYAATELPDGLTISTRTGVISGTPLVADASLNKDGLSVTVTASDGRGGSADATFTLLINAEPSGTVTIGPKADNEWELITTSTVVDANGIDETKTSYQWYKDNNTEVGTNRDTYPIPIDGRRGGTRYRVDVTFIDNIGQSVTTSSNVYEILNQAPVIDPISQKTVNESGTVSINPTVTDANNDDLTYTWRVFSGDSNASILANVTTNTESISFTVPADWIKDASTATDVTKTLQLEIAVTEMRDEGETTTRTAEVVVKKFDNGASTAEPKIIRDESNERRLILETGDDTEAIAADPDGGVNPPAISYQWQWCQSSCSLMSPSWMDISGQTEDTYFIPISISDTRVDQGDRFRIKISIPTIKAMIIRYIPVGRLRLRVPTSEFAPKYF